MKRALVVGNSDGIGLAVTRALLDQGYAVAGISRRAAPIDHPHYVHHVQDVSGAAYRDLLSGILARDPELSVCIYCVGIGDPLSLDNLAFETKVFDVNLMSAAVTTELVLGHMIQKDAGHFIGLSSIADALTSAEGAELLRIQGRAVALLGGPRPCVAQAQREAHQCALRLCRHQDGEERQQAVPHDGRAGVCRDPACNRETKTSRDQAALDGGAGVDPGRRDAPAYRGLVSVTAP